jgi:hypothetical protein
MMATRQSKQSRPTQSSLDALCICCAGVLVLILILILSLTLVLKGKLVPDLV